MNNNYKCVRASVSYFYWTTSDLQASSKFSTKSVKSQSIAWLALMKSQISCRDEWRRCIRLMKLNQNKFQISQIYSFENVKLKSPNEQLYFFSKTISADVFFIYDNRYFQSIYTPKLKSENQLQIECTWSYLEHHNCQKKWTQEGNLGATIRC